MLDNIRLARELVTDNEFDRFASDWRNVYAATRCLEIISEASRRLDTASKDRHPEVPWRDVAGAGSVYRHGYEGAHPRRVWDTIVEGLPTLEAAVRAELDAIG